MSDLRNPDILDAHRFQKQGCFLPKTVALGFQTNPLIAVVPSLSEGRSHVRRRDVVEVNREPVIEALT